VAPRLNLEITESLFMEPSQIVHLALARLRAAGVGIVLDDFGTGYSSLSYIHAFPIDKIKIDKSFVSGLPADRDASAIVRAVAVLASDLGVRLNAEGIESGIQADFLALAGVVEGQGHLFGKPQPAAEFRRLLAAQVTPSQVTA
jgi:EAL domain-containing protein (putative c-di-GMP-specific phosphodiesterase class I)